MQNNQLTTTIFCSAKTQYENLGDLIINKTLLSLMRNYGSLLIDDYEVPEWFCQELEIKDNERASKHYGKLTRKLIFIFTLKRLFQPNNRIYLLLTPGHTYHSEKSYSVTGVIKNLISFLVLRLIGVRICRFGASIGPFATISRISERWQAKFMYFYSVRDNISKEYAHKIGIDKVQIFPDLAWIMEKPSHQDTNFNIDGEYVLFSFRKSSHELDDPINYQSSLYTTLDEIVKLVCTDWQKKLVISYQVSRDYEVCKNIMDRYKGFYEIIFIEEQIDRRSVFSLYSHASMIFSNRLHVLMFAMICGSIPVAVVDASKHDKITGIFSDAGLMRLVIDIRNGVDQLKVLSNIAINTKTIKEQIATCIKQRKNTAEYILQSVMCDADKFENSHKS
ncbi:MAG: polysaccharide pyruvyl transferase family protein [Nostoc sp. CreGUA01]|nr:polysaccharide pyruvyl transferase family protein [Nostoc sp. CreGUA01]